MAPSSSARRPACSAPSSGSSASLRGCSRRAGSAGSTEARTVPSQMVPWVTWAQLAKAVERVEKYERHGFSFGPRERAEAALERATRFHAFGYVHLLKLQKERAPSDASDSDRMVGSFSKRRVMCAWVRLVRCGVELHYIHKSKNCCRTPAGAFHLLSQVGLR